MQCKWKKLTFAFGKKLQKSELKKQLKNITGVSRLTT